MKEAGHKIESGFELYVNGNIPNGSGLSSSASLELLVGIVAEELFDLKLDLLDLVHRQLGGGTGRWQDRGY